MGINYAKKNSFFICSSYVKTTGKMTFLPGKKLRKEEFIFWFAPATWKLREKITYLPGKKLRRNILPGNFSQGRKFPGKNTPRELIPGEKNPCTPVGNSLRTQYAGNSRRFYFNEHVARYLKLRTLLRNPLWYQKKCVKIHITPLSLGKRWLWSWICY